MARLNSLSRCLGLLALLLFTQHLVAEVSVTPETPLIVVSRTVNKVISTLRDGSYSQSEKRELVSEIIGERFDFNAMSSRVLATNWKKASPQQQRRFTDLFRQLLTNTYWQKISGYQNETVEYIGETMRGDERATVKTLIQTATVSIPVDYKLYRRDGAWYAYDVVVEQVSLVRNYRGSFQMIAMDEGIGGLLTKLEAKVNEAPTE